MDEPLLLPESFFALEIPPEESVYEDVTYGGLQELVLHKNYETETQHVILTEDMDTAYMIAKEFSEVTGRQARPRKIRLRELDEHFHLRIYLASGYIVDCSQDDYKELLRQQNDVPEE